MPLRVVEPRIRGRPQATSPGKMPPCQKSSGPEPRQGCRRPGTHAEARATSRVVVCVSAFWRALGWPAGGGGLLGNRHHSTAETPLGSCRPDLKGSPRRPLGGGRGPLPGPGSLAPSAPLALACGTCAPDLEFILGVLPAGPGELLGLKRKWDCWVEEAKSFSGCG